MTLLDSLNKRLIFLQELCTQLEIKAEFLHDRAEQAGRAPALRERFDVVTARAVAALPVLCEYCLPFAKVGGVFIAMKGPDITQELEAAAPVILALGGGAPSLIRLRLPVNPAQGEIPLERCLVMIKKERPTPAKYPRAGGKIGKGVPS